MSHFVELRDYDASIHRDILDALVREDEPVIEICEDRAIAEMRCYLSKRYDCDRIFSATGEERNQLVLMMVIDIAVYHIFCIHNPQKLSPMRKDRYERAVEWRSPSRGRRSCRRRNGPETRTSASQAIEKGQTTGNHIRLWQRNKNGITGASSPSEAI